MAVSKIETIIIGDSFVEVKLHRENGESIDCMCSAKESYYGYSYEIANTLVSPSSPTPTEGETQLANEAAISAIKGNKNGYGYYSYYTKGRKSVAEIDSFLKKASKRLTQIKDEGALFCSPIAREMLNFYFENPKNFTRNNLNPLDLAEYFIPAPNFEKSIEKSLFTEKRDYMLFGVPFFMELSKRKHIPTSLALLIKEDRPTFYKNFIEALRLLAKREDEELIKICEGFPIINDETINPFLLKWNHGVGIALGPLYRYLCANDRYEDLCYALAQTDVYHPYLANDPDSPYLYCLSTLHSHGFQEEAVGLAKALSKKTEDIYVYSYLSHFLSNKEKEAYSQLRGVPTFQVSKYYSKNAERASYFALDLHPTKYATRLPENLSFRLFGLGFFEQSDIARDKEDIMDYKKSLRSYLRYHPADIDYGIALAAIRLSDASALKTIFDSNDFHDTELFMWKAEYRRSLPKKNGETKVYLAKKEER